ncbi:K02A2.6-like [Cordylochernes scorpioides]|uniref:K02A2.6-like n=1 Tax=Cordylochernes scorpioides TaxID=51811 RepID=A0ABY6L237_9ARAC|nr:K02A2.6-like [Cordylochernes scorpioides]
MKSLLMDYGLGVFLSHRNDRKEECPIAFTSRKLTEAEKPFSQLEKKALSITFGVEIFRQYLLGRKLVLVTDNRPLIHIFSPHKPIPICATSRIKRWSLKIAAFNYTVEFRKTSDNSNVDALSRLPLESSVRESLDEDQVLLLRKLNEVPFSFMEVAYETPQDKILSIVLRNVREGNCVCIDSIIDELTRECRVCQELANMSPATISEWTWPEKPWHRLHLDLADNGRQFVSGEFEQFTKMNGVRHTKTSGYNPSTNGLAERYVREFKNLLRKNNGKDDLETILQRFLFAHRASPQTVIKEFPRGTANEEKFKIEIHEFNSKMGNPREVFHEAVRKQEQFTTGCEVYFRNYATGPKRRYRNAIAIETPLQSETRRALRRLRYSEARVAAAQTMQVPVQRIQLWTHKPFSGLQYNTHIDYKADSSVDIGQMSRVCQFCSALRFRDEPFGLCFKQGRVSLPAIEFTTGRNHRWSSYTPDSAAPNNSFQVRRMSNGHTFLRAYVMVSEPLNRLVWNQPRSSLRFPRPNGPRHSAILLISSER